LFSNGKKPMNTLRLRDARPGDREAILEVTLSAYREYATLMGPHWEGYQQNISATLADPRPAEQIVAEKEGAVVGSALLYPAGTVFLHRESLAAPLEWPEVRLLAVTPQARKQGIGAALIHECIKRATRSGAAFLTLHTSDMMQVAQRMYKRMGFVRAPDLDFHFDENTVKGYRLKLNQAAR
jgi:GNAT superfamily N-acetyltransferase